MSKWGFSKAKCKTVNAAKLAAMLAAKLEFPIPGSILGGPLVKDFEGGIPTSKSIRSAPWRGTPPPLWGVFGELIWR